MTFNSGSTVLAAPAVGPIAITGNLAFERHRHRRRRPRQPSSPLERIQLFTYTGTPSPAPRPSPGRAPGFTATFDTTTAGVVGLTLAAVAVVQPPTNLVASAGNASASLTWTAAPAATSYIRICAPPYPAGPTPPSPPASHRSPTPTPASTNGTTYHYVVTGVTPGGNADSNQASVSVGGSTPHGLLAFRRVLRFHRRRLLRQRPHRHHRQLPRLVRRPPQQRPHPRLRLQPARHRAFRRRLPPSMTSPFLAVGKDQRPLANVDSHRGLRHRHHQLPVPLARKMRLLQLAALRHPHRRPSPNRSSTARWTSPPASGPTSPSPSPAPPAPSTSMASPSAPTPP